ncbi:hypothetical protein QMT40_001831 [Parvibaculaceae bacterium PLY_AMNH_Bact1]|nr:hypothetical protein QMT40_001831 [Parvibaculaceae bacterium PLY_AMNH_Bact1]
MLLSFNIDEMRPWIVNGLKELAGEPVEGRVKRQTIRRFGPLYVKKFGTSHHLEDLQLDLWWKSRTPGGFKFGQATGSGTRITILNAGSRLALETVDFQAFKAASTVELNGFSQADGFNSDKEFLEYFVPKEGDVFEGVLFRW